MMLKKTKGYYYKLVRKIDKEDKVKFVVQIWRRGRRGTRSNKYFMTIGTADEFVERYVNKEQEVIV